ncbi:hypothetical protein RchiOBHm_Chr1g0332521 [Rosa chinensis]|uniref:RNase H type-1 domain-containing protein n=1 Tax=Rosa chinensis TaxID=74649 RepID=A0A2P6SBT5_ROSCH|nr:uncharacterized protein LOC121050068 [Rosa chinensis]PRQ56142.1 hypothetical protein RchiOBHm_Chr1g0332521 [Rosa chinensis]
MLLSFYGTFGNIGVISFSSMFLIYNPSIVASLAFAASREFLQIPPKLLPPRHSCIADLSTKETHWSAPQCGSLKLNTDAAWDEDSNSCGLAVVIHDSSGVIVGGSSRFLLCKIPFLRWTGRLPELLLVYKLLPAASIVLTGVG